MSMTNEEASNILRLLATEALEGVSRFVKSENFLDNFKQAYEMAIKSLEDAVQIVRCKECVHWENGLCFKSKSEDWYCGDGARRSEWTGLRRE